MVRFIKWLVKLESCVCDPPPRHLTLAPLAHSSYGKYAQAHHMFNQSKNDTVGRCYRTLCISLWHQKVHHATGCDIQSCDKTLIPHLLGMNAGCLYTLAHLKLSYALFCTSKYGADMQIWCSFSHRSMTAPQLMKRLCELSNTWTNIFIFTSAKLNVNTNSRSVNNDHLQIEYMRS